MYLLAAVFRYPYSEIQGTQSREGKGRRESYSDTRLLCSHLAAESQPSSVPSVLLLLEGDGQHLETLSWLLSSKNLGVEVRTQMQFIFLC